MKYYANQIRCLCKRCKKPVKSPERILIQEGFLPEQLDKMTLFMPTGCDKCLGGYKGRVGIYETVPITEEISRVIMEGGNWIQIADLASKAGFNCLRKSALEKVAQGITSLEEVNRITYSGRQSAYTGTQ